MNRDEELKMIPMRLAEPAKWPPGVRAIGIKEQDAFGVDAAGVLHWHGKPVEIKHPVTLNTTQSYFAIAAAVSAIVIAVIEVLRFFGRGAF